MAVRISKFEERTSKAARQEDAVALFEREVKTLGYKYFDVGSMSVAKISDAKTATRFYATNYLDEEPWGYFPNGWSDQNEVLAAMMQRTRPIDYVEFVRALPVSPTSLLHRGIMKLWNVTHAWLVPLNTPHFVQFVTVYMINGNQNDFDSTRETVFGLSAVLMDRLIEIHEDPANPQQGPLKLSDREAACLKAIARGLTNAQIADELGVSQNTVRFHLKNLFVKLGVSNRSEAAVAGLRLGYSD